MQLEEVVMIDLDCLGSCTPELGSPGDDYFLLPHARELEDVFEVVREHIKSPTEFDSSPKCTELLQVSAAAGGATCVAALGPGGWMHLGVWLAAWRRG
jgi:hypothetical protein